jgi:flagellar biogenesis protein FliO
MLDFLNRIPGSKQAKIIGFIVIACIAAYGALFLAAGAPSDPMAESSTSPASTTFFIFDVIVKLGIVLLLIAASAYLLRRWKGGAPTGVSHQIILKETVHLSQRQTLHLVQVGEETFLIGATDQSLTLLAPVETQEAEETPKSVPAQDIDFLSLLRGKMAFASKDPAASDHSTNTLD